jgi:sugar phosphate isomerase/epimerase
MKISICNELYFDRTFEAACAHARALGYEGIEIAPFTLGEHLSDVSARRRRELRHAAAEQGLEIVGLHWLLAKTEGMHITASNPVVRDRTLAYLRELVSLCAELGGRVMVWGSPQQRTFESDSSIGEAFSRAREMIQQLVPTLEAHKVDLAIEPLGPEETNFLTTARAAVELAESIASPRVGLTLDVKAMSTESKSIPEIIHSSKQWLKHFHANDPNRRGPGMGNVKFASIATALHQIGYTGWISVEVFDYSPGVEVLASESICTLKQFF